MSVVWVRGAAPDTPAEDQSPAPPARGRSPLDPPRTEVHRTWIHFGVPGPLKNAVDWTSRGPRGRVWKGKRVAVIGGSPGPSGTRSAQFAWWPILRVLGARIHPDVLSVHGVASGFVDGRPTEELARRLTDFAVTLSTAP